MLRNFLCNIGFHKWEHIWGSANRYFECTHCCARTVRLARGCYQPVDGNWLHHGPFYHPHIPGKRPGPRPPTYEPPLMGWNGYVAKKPLPEVPAEYPPDNN